MASSSEEPAPRHRLVPLTSLQIGDIQSYVSKLFVYLDDGSKQQVFFVDNRPWTAESNRPKTVELWQLMVTQSRRSPFANQSRSPTSRLYKEDSAELDSSAIDSKLNLRRMLFQEEHRLVKFFRNAFQNHLKSVAGVQDLSYLLHGCVTFEVRWEEVRGMNYVNELLTDTCVALETKQVVKRTFSSFQQALMFYGITNGDTMGKSTALLDMTMGEVDDTKAMGFVGTPPMSLDRALSGRLSSCFKLEESCLDGTAVRDDTGNSKLGPCTSSWRSNSNSWTECGLVIENKSIDTDTCSICSLMDAEGDGDTPQLYRDTLLVYRFCDPTLPFSLEKIITADQRLLKMLESGLPSWVVFLQSYPVVSKFYRPWMRAFARTMYVLVSIITVIIGFYDLYKNVPVLKATVARICGPLFEWIEAWEMVSRIKYLLTVLFLQNWEKAFRWLLLIFKTSRQLCTMLMMPMVEPLEDLAEFVLPIWNMCADGVWGLATLVWVAISSFLDFTSGLIQLIVWPFVVLLSTVWNIAAWLLYPFVSGLWGLIILPIRLVVFLFNLIVAVVCSLYTAVLNIWSLVYSSFQLFSVATPSHSTALKAAKSSSSMWRLLWHDIFSQVFRAVRSIVNGLVAFFTTCNRHRLSIYNHVSASTFRLAYLVKYACFQLSEAYYHILKEPLQNEGGFEDEHNPLAERPPKSLVTGLKNLRARHSWRRKETITDMF